ncbi:MAG TPA: hypothetical protein VFS88_03140 [Micavibrio sp.]|nr:hypothetical protein [Micavibrio sp.]
MPRKIGNIIVIFALTAGAVLAGYEFLTIRMDGPFIEQGPPPEPVLTVETLPDAAVAEPQVIEPAPAIVPNDGERIVTRIRDSLTVRGSKVMDTRYFTDQAACDVAVRTVAEEYKRRGIRDQDMAETVPFPESRGAVVMFTNRGVLHYIGCVAPPDQNWAVYVQYIPNGRK